MSLLQILHSSDAVALQPLSQLATDTPNLFNRNTLQQQGFYSSAQLTQALATEASAAARVQSARALVQWQQLRVAQTVVKAPDFQAKAVGAEIDRRQNRRHPALARSHLQALKLEPQPQVVVAFGFLITNCAPCRSSL